MKALERKIPTCIWATLLAISLIFAGYHLYMAISSINKSDNEMILQQHNKKNNDAKNDAK
ncbi:hypothetical protein [Poriferisphaera corsica]|uniref:hypothetical protein n=1 Tax=Poriferisphaera corsica TaxID=2528020 RepID=UPI00119F5813|nr:hypothetical protein [Poriferisphaera corsica]